MFLHFRNQFLLKKEMIRRGNNIIVTSTAPQPLKSWLVDPKSTTQKIRRLGLKMSVKIIRQGKGFISYEEQKLLGLPYKSLCWIREVELRCNGKRFMQARAIIPCGHFHPRLNPFELLKSVSLGSWIFSFKNRKRGPFSYFFSCQGNQAFYSRRSLFILNGSKLLLTEIFSEDFLL